MESLALRTSSSALQLPFAQDDNDVREIQAKAGRPLRKIRAADNREESILFCCPC